MSAFSASAAASAPRFVVAALLLLLVDCLSTGAASAQCSSQVSGPYNVTLCPLPSTAPPVQTAPTTLLYSWPQEGDTAQLQLPFAFHLFGSAWDRLWVSTNGLLLFGAKPFYGSAESIPAQLSYADSLPMIAPWWNSLYLNTSVGNISWSVEGAAPSRSFVVRFNHIIYYGSSTDSGNPGSDSGVTFDAVLYEGVGGGFDFKYYAIQTPPPSDGTDPGFYSISIGAENNDDGQTYSILSYDGVRASESSAFFGVLANLSGQSAHWSYMGQDDSTRTCSGAGFDFSAYANMADLTFTDASNTTYYVHPCGAVTAAACASSVEGAQACAVSPTGSATLIARYQPAEATYNVLSGSPVQGVQVAYQNGAYCNALSAESIAAFNFVCDRTATTAPVLQNVTVYSTCLYTITMRSSIACGAANVAPLNSTSTLTSCVSATGSNYTSTWCPLNATSIGATPITQTNPQVVPLPPTPSYIPIAVATVPIGFTFSMYGTPYQTVSVGSHGVLSFGSVPSANSLSSFPIVAGSGVDDYPLIAAFGIPLLTSAVGAPLLSGNITYSVEGSAPNRRFVVRYSNLPISATLFGAVLATPQTSFDIVLYEGMTGAVDIFYYSVPSAAGSSTLPGSPSQQVIIGVHGDADTSTSYTTYSVLNKQTLTLALASQLQGSVLSFRYSGVLPSAACGAFGANFSSLSTTDYNYTDSSGTQWYLRPCGVVANPVCAQSPATAYSSSCQVVVSPTTATATLLSVYNPSAMSYTASPVGPGVRARLADGAFCGAAYPGSPRVTNIDFLCVRGDPRTLLTNVTEGPTCTYTFTLQTPAACAATTACEVQVGDVYTSTLCSVLPTALTQTAPTTVYTAASAVNTATEVLLPFDFHFYGVPYDRVNIVSNGLLEFGTTAYGFIGSLPIGGPVGDSLPAFAPFTAPLSVANAGTVTYSLETIGTSSSSSGTRAFVIRFSNVDYLGFATAGSENAASFDVLLYEGVSGTIDVRYYRVDANAAVAVTVGMQAPAAVSSIFLPYPTVPLHHCTGCHTPG